MLTTMRYRKQIQLFALAVMVFALWPSASFAGSSYPAYHSPKPSGPYIEYHAPDSYPFTFYDKKFNVGVTSTFVMPKGEFDTQPNIDRNTPFKPFVQDKQVFMYFGPNKLGSVQLLNGGGCRLTPDKQAYTPFDLASRLHFWHWRYEYDWSLVNYWYSVPCHYTTYCWSGGCSGTGKDTYCWSGGCYTYADDWNYYEVYYWTKGSFLRKLRQAEYRDFEIRLNLGKRWDPVLKTWVDNYKSFWSPTTGVFDRVTPNGLGDFKFTYTGEIMNFDFYWYGYNYKHPLEKIVVPLEAYVHPLPPENPTWRMDVDNVWREKIDDTKVKLQFRWKKPSLNKNQENYYIEYSKLFDGKIKMRDVVQLLSNLGYDQVDVPVYMALESAEPKLYLVTTPRLVKGVKKAPMPYTPIPQSSYLSRSGVIPGFTLHPSAESQSRGYLRECTVPYKFDSTGKPQAGPVKYVFSKIFDANSDGRIDSSDKAYFERGLAVADFDEDNDVDADDCSALWTHSFVNFPIAFEKLAEGIKAAFTKDPRLFDNATLTAYVGPIPIDETYMKSDKPVNTVRHIQIGWIGNAKEGTFYASDIPGAASKKFPLSTVNFRYNTREFPKSTGKDFLPNLGPMPHPHSPGDASAFPQLYKSDTATVGDGTTLGYFKRLVVQAYKKGDMTQAHCYPVGDPWGVGVLESLESGWMGILFILGDADGDGALTTKDLAKWDEVKAMEGFVLNTVWQHEIGVAVGKAVVTDLNKEFRVIAGGKFSAYPPAGADSFTLKESYNYKFIKPTIWAYDPKDGNQMSFGREFVREPGGWDPSAPAPKPPYPPTEVRYLPTAIIGPNDIPEDIPQTWRAPGVEQVIIKPGEWTQTWTILGDSGGGSGETMSHEFKNAGRYTIVHTVKYTQRIVTPVTDSMGIIVYYAVTDIPQTRTLTLDVRVFDHTVAEFDDPKLELKGPGNIANYAPQWGSLAADLRKRDFPSSFEAYPKETSSFDIRSLGLPTLNDNDWKARSAPVSGKEYIDNHFDLVDAREAAYDFKLGLEIKFARQVNETSDLNVVNTLDKDDLECYSGILLSPSEPITVNIEVKQLMPGGGSKTHKSFTYIPDVSKFGTTNIDPSAMGEYLVKVGDRFMKLKTVKFTQDFFWNLPVPTFPNEGYETVITLNATKRIYSLDRYGTGKITYTEPKVTYVWRRKSFTVDVTPPVITAFEEHDGKSGMTSVADSVIHGTTGDETEYRFAFTDNHPNYGPNDGLKDGGTRRAWYPRLWFQRIDGAKGCFTGSATSGYELPLILPSVTNRSAMLSTDPDGNLAADITNFAKERIDGHRLSVVAPSDIDKLGTKDVSGMTIRHRFSNYIAGKIAYVIEVEDSSRNFARLEGHYKIVDNKRPNIDVRIATPKYKPLPDDGSLKSISQIISTTPLGPTASPYGELKWAPSSSFVDEIAKRTAPSKQGLIADWLHPYSSSDMSFGSGGFVSLLQAPGYTYARESSLDEPFNNLPITEHNTSKWDDPIITLTDKDIKAAFQVANPGSPGLAEDEPIVFDVSMRDNLLFWQDDSEAPYGRIVADRNFRKITYTFLEDVIDERKVRYTQETSGTPVKSAFDIAPLRILGEDETPLSHIFRVGNANPETGLKNSGTGANTGSNTVQLDAIDLGNNSRRVFIDLPIIPSRFNVRVLESESGADRQTR